MHHHQGWHWVLFVHLQDLENGGYKGYDVWNYRSAGLLGAGVIAPKASLFRSLINWNKWLLKRHVYRLTDVNLSLAKNTNATKPDRIAFCDHLILILLKRGTSELPASPWWLTNPSSLLLHFQRVFLIADADIDAAKMMNLSRDPTAFPAQGVRERDGSWVCNKSPLRVREQCLRRHLLTSESFKNFFSEALLGVRRKETRDTCN